MCMLLDIDWLLMLPKELNSKYNEELEKMKGEKGMEDLDMSISPTFRSSYEQGKEQGIEQGYKVFVSMLADLGKDQDFILSCLQSKYNLTPEIALQKYNLYHN